jgi:hypothetical protein
MDNATLVQQFIGRIWNNNAFDELDAFLHPDFKDHSLPPLFSPDRDGLKNWIVSTGISFEHRTFIEEQVTEGDKCITKIRMDLKHIGVWRDLEPTGKNVHAIGYRYFKLKEGKIIDHWALIDGMALENQIKDTALGCKAAE